MMRYECAEIRCEDLLTLVVWSTEDSIYEKVQRELELSILRVAVSKGDSWRFTVDYYNDGLQSLGAKQSVGSSGMSTLAVKCLLLEGWEPYGVYGNVKSSDYATHTYPCYLFRKMVEA